MGKSIKRVFTLRLNDEDYEKMRTISERNNRSMANYIEWLCKTDIDRYEKENGVISVLSEE